MPRLIAENVTKLEADALKSRSSVIGSALPNGKSAKIDVEDGRGILGPSLSWADVNFEVGGKKILESVSGVVTGGSVCAILGPSGAGKQTFGPNIFIFVEQTFDLFGDTESIGVFGISLLN